MFLYNEFYNLIGRRYFSWMNPFMMSLENKEQLLNCFVNHMYNAFLECQNHSNEN